MDDRRQPLLGGAPPKAVAGPSRSQLAAPALALAYLLATTVDRVAFARMTAHMPHEVLLMHAALAALHTALFMVLRLARSQSSRSAVSEKLQRMRPLELLAMATLDALQSLLALDGATHLCGTMQVMLLQGIVPATVLFSPLLPADPLRPQTYSKLQIVAAVALAIGVVTLLLPPPPEARVLAYAGPWLLSQGGDGSGDQSQSSNQVGGQGDDDGGLSAADLAAGPWPARLAFAGSSVFAALSAAYKRRCLTRAPLDPLLLNSWLGATQLCVGIVLGPPLLLLLHGTPIGASVRGLLDSTQHLFHCCGAPRTVEEAGPHAASRHIDAVTTPLLLVFFTASTVSSVAALLCLRRAGDGALAFASALVLPATLLAFLRPVPLPFWWAAPPEPLLLYHAAIALLMSATLAAYHAAGVSGCLEARAPVRMSAVPPPGPGGGTAPGGGLVVAQEGPRRAYGGI